MNFVVTESWRQAFRGASAGFVALEGVSNPPGHPALEAHLREVEADLRARFAGATRAELAALPEFQAYRAHYRQWDKTYHVQLQWESVVLKGKPLRSAGALVTAMFAAEMRNRLLTAGHDVDRLDGAVSLCVSRGGETYAGMGERPLTLQPGDMFMSDGTGIISNVLYGPDHRTRLTESSTRAVFTVYAPAGIQPEAVRDHLDEIARMVRLVSPGAAVLRQEVHTAG
ncbi:MAG TPA: hypothetical protein VGK74_12675 [Symbiobacteriaceae bacterium]|jgi:DNA/RNA-binding domain of Phe-tRNA-synthetase-like protein